MAGIDPPPDDPRDDDPGEYSSSEDDCNELAEQPGFGNGTVYVRMESTAKDGKLPSCPFLLQRTVEAFLGEKVLEAVFESRGTSIALKIRNEKLAKKLTSMKKVHNTPIKISFHPTRNTIRCVVSNINCINKSEDELLKKLRSQGVVQVQRIKRKAGEDYENTPAVILTIRGNTVPEKINFGWIRCSTRPYYQTPMLCYKCWNFGHTKKRCTADEICGHCGKDKHLDDTNNRCDREAYCHCCDSKQHAASSRKCPTYLKENDIQKLRTDRNISYPEAKKMWETANGSNSYANITARSTVQTSAFDELSKKVDMLFHAITNGNQSAVENARDIEMQNLAKKIEQIQEENRRKDKKIQELTETIRAREASTANTRMDITQKYGNLEDLVAQVGMLQDALKKRDATIAQLTQHPTAEPVTEMRAENIDLDETAISDTEANGNCISSQIGASPTYSISDAEMVETSQQTHQRRYGGDYDTDDKNNSKRTRSSSRGETAQWEAKKQKPKLAQTGKPNRANKH